MTQSKNNIALTYGLIAGIAVIAWTLILYVLGVKYYVGPLAYVAMVIPIVVAVLGGLAQRKSQDGYLSFKEALKTVFLIFIIFVTLDAIFSYLLLSVIDVPFREAIMQEAAVSMEKMMEKMGAKQDAIDKALESMNDPGNYSPSKILLGILFRYVGWFIIALIIAAIIKKKKPEFADAQF